MYIYSIDDATRRTRAHFSALSSINLHKFPRVLYSFIQGGLGGKMPIDEKITATFSSSAPPVLCRCGIVGSCARSIKKKKNRSRSRAERGRENEENIQKELERVAVVYRSLFWRSQRWKAFNVADIYLRAVRNAKKENCTITCKFLRAFF